jgi:N utilization substance protein A
MKKELITLFEYLEREKGIKREVIVKAITESIQAAARRNVKGLSDKVHVEIDLKYGELEVFVPKKIVETVVDPKEEISLDDARILEPGCEVGQTIGIVISPEDYGRIAAQAARQLMTQKIKTAEKDVVIGEYQHRVGELISGTVKAFRGRTVIVELPKVDAFLYDRDYIRSDRYNVGDKVHALLYEVRNTETGGAEVLLTRTKPEYVLALFKNAVPEISDNTVEIARIEREPGLRTKIAVVSHDPKVDPIGACIGSKGSRISPIVADLNGERIDVVRYDESPLEFLHNLINPIKELDVQMFDSKIQIVVRDEDYAPVIGKQGSNVRLIGKMLGVEFEVKQSTEYQKLLAVRLKEMADSENPALDGPLQVPGISSLILDGLKDAGYQTYRDFMRSEKEEIAKIPGANYNEIAEILLEQFSSKQEMNG